MTTPTPEQAQKHIEAIRAHHEKQRARLEEAVQAAEDKGYSGQIEKARKELSDFETVAKNSLALAEAKLKEAEKADNAQKAEKAAKEKAQADKKEAQAKGRALRAFVNAGGRREDFNAQWPAMWEVILRESVTNGPAKEESGLDFPSM